MLHPNVSIDPAWNARTCQILENKNTQPNNILQRTSNNLQKQIHQEKTKSIINTEENELSDEEKINLLISRVITDQYSNVGRVYRGLIEFFYERVHLRDLHTATVEDLSSCVAAKVKENNGTSEVETDKRENNDAASTTPYQEQKQEDNSIITIHRERRIDAHAVIHYTIQTLFESKPNLEQSNSPNPSSNVVSTLCKNIIEALILGELYTSLQQEIRLEMYHKDNALSSTIHLFLNKTWKEDENGAEDGKMTYPESISIQALDSICALPEARSANTKLNCCMHFIECISLSYSKQQQNSTATTPQTTDTTNVTTLMCTDSLLTLVCQHIIYAQIPFLNADIAFVEEFIRDEQLHKGKEGYVLVTIQASLSFLNGCSLMNLKELFLSE